MDENLPELVRDYKLKTWYDQGVIIHEHHDPDVSPLAGPRQEKWKKVRTLGSRSQGVIELEECIDGSRCFTQRAVKKIRLQNKDSNKVNSAKRRYQRELATMVRFSHDRVCCNHDNRPPIYSLILHLTNWYWLNSTLNTL